jgi:hypothetical protein
MKRTPLKRKTALKAKSGISSRKVTKKRSTSGNKSKSIRLLKKKLWNECKRIVRLRYQKHNGGWDCFTCGAHLDIPAKAQTGHFIPSSVCSTEMRYDLGNLRVQCYRCNINLSGNWIEYEKRLNKEMGEGYTEKLKARNESTKNGSYRADWYEMYIKNYKQIVD